MTCCLNPNCLQPLNPDSATTCADCGTPLVSALRGRYRPIRLLGRGGFGRTYLAVDADRLNSPCVIKQFAPQTQGTKSFYKAVSLFEQEAVRLNELGEHSQIPSLWAYFEHEQYLYLVQEMVQGKTLFQQLQADGPLSESALRLLLEDLLPVLHFIHQRGVIHRDITPTNIIQRKLDRKYVLIDFGVAKQFSEAVAYEPGTRIGTEGYAPIEQLRSGQAYPSSDLYSLGATCLHLLTGCKPEDLYNPLEGRWMWVERLQQQGRTIDPRLQAILNMLVEDLVSERYPNAPAVLQDLQRLPKLQGEVPGWRPQGGTGGLFARMSSPPRSGPATSPRSGFTIPTTALPPSGPSSVPPGGAPPSGRGQQPPPPPPRPVRSGRTSAPGQTSGPKRTSGPGRLSGPTGPGWHCVATLTGHKSWVTTVVFNPKIPTLISGSIDDTIRVWNWQNGQLIYTLNAHPRGVNHLAISANGQVLASCGDDDIVRVWNLADGSLTRTLRGHLRDVTAVALDATGTQLVSGSEDRTLKQWDLASGSLVKTLTGAAGLIKAVALMGDGQRVVSGGLDNKLRLWDLASGTMAGALVGHVNSVYQVAASPDGVHLASASKDRTVRYWDSVAGSLRHTLTGHSQEVNAVAFFPGGKSIVSGSSDGSLKVWDCATAQCRHTLTSHGNPVYGVAVHSSGRLIASGSADKTVKLWKWQE